MDHDLKQYLCDLVDGDKASLVNIKAGAMVEMFDRALDAVLRNISDINTTLEARTVTLTLSIKPSEDRSLVEWGAKVRQGLAGQEAIKGTADVSMDSSGRVVARERGKVQQSLFENVTSISKGGKNK